MKKIYFILILVLCRSVNLLSQGPVVYINLNSHNETSGTGELNYDNNSSRNDYDTAFKYIKQVADMVVAKGVKFNFQSDVKFLLGCLKWDQHLASTNNTNLVKWMDDWANIECDPHSHEGKYPPVGPLSKFYNYSDVAHLHDSLGATNRKNAGGFKVDGLQNQSHWPDFEVGQPGKAYSTSGAWQPNVLWGGSYKAGVHNDMKFFGSYKPVLDTNNAESYTSNTSQRLRIQGNGCSMVFHDSTNEQRIVRELGKLFRNVHYGVYPANEFYTPVLQINCRDIYKPNYVSRLTTIIDSINNYVTLGWVDWKTISEKDAIWTSVMYQSANKRIDCDNLPTGIGENSIQNSLSAYPNPITNKLNFVSSVYIQSIKITDALGRQVYIENNINGDKKDIDTELLLPGVYFVSFYLNDGKQITKKILKE